MKPATRISSTYPASPLVTEVSPLAAFRVEQEFRLTQMRVGTGFDRPSVHHFDPPYVLHPGQRYALVPPKEDAPAAIWLIEPVEGAEGEWEWLREADRAS